MLPWVVWARKRSDCKIQHAASWILDSLNCCFYSTPYGGRGRTKPTSPALQIQKPEERIDILVAGFEPGTEAGVVPYLVQKSKKKWEPVDVKLDQGQMLITVNDPLIARILVRLDG